MYCRSCSRGQPGPAAATRFLRRGSASSLANFIMRSGRAIPSKRRRSHDLYTFPTFISAKRSSPSLISLFTVWRRLALSALGADKLMRVHLETLLKPSQVPSFRFSIPLTGGPRKPSSWINGWLFVRIPVSPSRALRSFRRGQHVDRCLGAAPIRRTCCNPRSRNLYLRDPIACRRVAWSGRRAILVVVTSGLSRSVP